MERDIPDCLLSSERAVGDRAKLGTEKQTYPSEQLCWVHLNCYAVTETRYSTEEGYQLSSGEVGVVSGKDCLK